MAATLEDMTVASDLEEKPRVMDGHILRQEIFESVSLATRLTTTYEDSGRVASQVLEDI